MVFKINLVVYFMPLLISLVLSVSMEQKYVELEKEFESLRDNVTAMRSEMVATDVLRLYLNQEISFRNHLEQQMKEMVKNYTNMESLYQSTLSELRNAKSELNDLERKYTDLQRNTNHTNQRLEEVVKNNTDLQGLYQGTKRDFHDLNMKYIDLQRNISVLRLLNEDDLQQTYDLRRLHDTLHQEVRQLSVAMVETKDDLDFFNRSLRIELEGELRLVVQEDIAELNGTNQAMISNVQTVLEKYKQEESKISFSVGLSSIRQDLANKVIPYDIVDTNIGSGYDNNTGIFTAPMAGNYVFSWNSYSTNGLACELYLYRNGVRQKHSAYSALNTSYNYATPSSTILTLMRGDRIWIQGSSCYYLNGRPYSYFIGFKL